REELKAYDPGLAKICEEAFGETELVYTKPATRLHGHLEGLDLKNAPRFTWPERLNKVRAGIKRAGRNRGCEKLGRSPLKVYILAGQSNMEGHGLIELSDRQVANYRKKGLNEEQIAVKRGGTLKELIRAPKTMYRMAQVADENGEWVWRNDVWMHYERARSGLRNGPHGPGYGARDDRIGPEFQFGHLMGTVHEEQVLIIKTAWGGKSLAVDFRPPSSGKNPYTLNNKKEVFPGAYYRKMIGQVQGVLKNLKQLYPDYDGTGYELAGFCWHQGWNDGANEDFGKEYAANLVNFINDVREDLKAENLPFVIATSGFGGTGKRGGFVGRLQQWVQPAQLAAAEKLDHVVAIDTRPFFRPEEASPGRGDIEHWFSNAESYFLIGEAMAEAMKTLITR
ncbi:MAG: sialate O-acetylesterase, partial [Verrucomicrobiota bacterium]